MVDVFDVGDLIRSENAFSVSDTDTDPDAVKVLVKTPGGSVSEFVYGSDTDVIKDSTGNFYIDISMTESGVWRTRWEGTGAVTAAVEDFWSVRRQEVST